MPGYTRADSMPFVRDTLFSRTTGEPANINVVLASDTEDTTNTPTTYLRRGLVLTKITSGADAGKYRHYDNTASDGTEDEETMVVLYRDIDISDGEDHHAAAVIEGHIDPDQLIWTTPAAKAAFVWTSVEQRLIRQ